MIAYLDHANSPAGPLAFTVNESGALIRVSFLNGNYSYTLEEGLARDGYEILHDSDKTRPVREQIDAYTNGELQSFDLAVDPSGTEWQRQVWRELIRIPFGETRTYGEIAATVCTIRASRAVGRANGSNPIPLIIPCHRVIGSNGALTGFGGGLHLKKALLEHESKVLRAHPNAPAGTQRSLLTAD